MPPVHEEWLLTPQRAALHRSTGVAVIADLHLGYAQARRRGGEAVPQTEAAQLLTDFRILQRDHSVRQLVIAGDLAEAGLNAEVAADLGQVLRATGMELLAVVPGNHDRFTGGETFGLPIQPNGYLLGEWLIIHGDEPLVSNRLIYGHHHPCLVWQGMRIPCYLVRENALVLPAFSRDAAGVNVYYGAEWAAYHCHAIVGERVLDFGGCADLNARLRREPIYDGSRRR